MCNTTEVNMQSLLFLAQAQQGWHLQIRYNNDYGSVSVVLSNEQLPMVLNNHVNRYEWANDIEKLKKSGSKAVPPDWESAEATASFIASVYRPLLGDKIEIRKQDEDF